MKKKTSTLYFEKRYCLLVHSVVMQQRLAVTAFSCNSAEQEIIDRSCSYNVNQIVYINCIDLITEGVTTPDSSAQLHFTALGLRKNQKSPIAIARFQMNSEKIVKPESSLLFSKELEGGNGTLNYKFINLKTKSLTQEQYEVNRQQKIEISLQMQREETAIKMEELMQLLKQKDDLISRLETKIQHLIEQGKKRNASGSLERTPSQDNKISLNVKVNTANENMRKQNQKLIVMNRDLNDRVDQLEEQADNQAKEKQTLEREVNMLKKQIEKYEKITEMRKSKFKPNVPYMEGPNFLKNSIDNPMIMGEPNEPEPTPYSNPKIKIKSPAKVKEPVMHQSEVGSQQDAKRQSNSNDSKVLHRSGAPRNSIDMALSNHANREIVQVVQVPPKEEDEVELRINMQKEDFKWSSVIFDRNEEIDILKNKLQHKAGEVKTLEKELEKAKVALKKKDVEIKEMKRLSRKNLFLEEKEKGQTHNRGGLQLQFEKIQAEHDSEKVRLEQQIEQLDSLNQEKARELKRLKNTLEQTSSQLRSFEQKYLELKKFTQSSTEEFIEYKQKAQKYDTINLKNKDLEASIKNLDARLFVTTEENTRLTGALNKGTQKWKQRQKEWQKLKKMQREFDYQRNQNINLHQSIESYESRYNQLKKYCIKIESAYNKFVQNKKKSGKESQIMQDREQKQIQSRFIELNKKVNDCQINYYKQQIDQLQQEKNFVSIYFDRKLREQKDKIHDAKELSEEEKRQSTLVKEKEVEKGVADKMEEINSKLNKLSKIYEDVNQRIREDGQDSFIQSIPEKMRIIERKLSLILQRETERMAERKTLKDTVMHFSQQQQNNNKMRNSMSGVGSGQGGASGQGVGSGVGPSLVSGLNLAPQVKNKDSGLGKSMMNESRQRLSLLDEAKQRSELSQQRTYEQNRKMNTQLLKQNGELKMKNQKLAMQLQKVERKTHEREKNLEQMYKKTDLEFKLKNERLTDQVQKLTAEGELLKGKLTDSQQAVDNLEQELSDLSSELQKKEELIIQLEQRIVRYDERIEQYEEGQRKMLDEVGQIKRKSQLNQQQLFQLMEERNNNFLKIEKTKQTQIDKLSKIIKELQTNIEAEMYENIQNREKLQTMKTTMETGEKETQERLEQLRLTIQNKEKEIEEMYLKDYMTTRENETLQHSLIQISNVISDREAQVAELNYQLTSALKQNEVYKTQGKEFQNAETNMKEEMKNLNDLVADKTYQLKFFQEMMVKFRDEVQAAEKEMQKLSIANNRLDLENHQTQEKYLARMDEIISLKQANSLLRIDMERQKGYLTDLERTKQDLHKRTDELQKEVSQLHETNLNLKRKELEPNSGKKLPKRSNTVISGISDAQDMSSIGYGGITPIVPFTSLNISKRLDNPFEPKFEDKQPKLSLSRKISLNTEEKINTTEIAIHIEQPHEPVADKNTSSIAIEFDEGEESFRNTTHQLMSRTNNNILAQPTIGQEQEYSQQEQTVNFGRNIQLASQEESQPLDVSQPDITEYLQKIAQLEKELKQRNEKIETLTNDLAAFEKQNAQMHEQLQIASLQPPQLLQRPSNLGLSRKTTLDVPGFAASRLEVHTEKQLEPCSEEKGQLQTSKIQIHRSQSGANILASRDYSKQSQGGNYAELEQKCQAAELQIQFLNDNLNTAKTELEQQVKNNERLIEQAGLCNETIQALEKRLQQSMFECEHYKKYQIYQGMFNDQVTHSNELKHQIEELNMQNFQKDQRVSVLIKENGDLMERVTAMGSETAQTSDQKDRLLLKIKQLNSIIGRLKLQYRKYEEDSELQIVHLKETIDQYRQKLKTKDDQVNLLGEQYLELQSQISAKEAQLQQKEKTISKQANNSNEVQRRCNQLQKQVNQTQQMRQGLMKTIKRLQLQINQKGEDTSNFSKQTALTIKKYEIKLQTNQEEINKISHKTNEKEKTINLLKNQIGLYNQECDQLKKTNDELTYELDKVEKELKDIMQVYQKQIETFKLEITAKDDYTNKLNQLIKEKETEYATVFKQNRTIQKERDQLKSELIDVQSGLDKLKQGKAREYTDIYTQLQLKINDYEKLKTTLDKLKEDLAKNQQTHQMQVQKYQSRLKSYKDKLEKYELTIEELQTEFKTLQDRPSSQQHEEIVFENGVLRNRIDQLEQQLHKVDNKGKVEQIYTQFRKYKANKERQIQDLQAQMQKYGAKINELEESVFYLKKENERLNNENDEMTENREEMMMECEDLRESLQDVEKELVFYKNRKMLDMQKLLNDTNI